MDMDFWICAGIVSVLWLGGADASLSSRIGNGSVYIPILYFFFYLWKVSSRCLELRGCRLVLFWFGLVKHILTVRGGTLGRQSTEGILFVT